MHKIGVQGLRGIWQRLEIEFRGLELPQRLRGIRERLGNGQLQRGRDASPVLKRFSKRRFLFGAGNLCLGRRRGAFSGGGGHGTGRGNRIVPW
jgi:hypothetical protein